VVFRRRHAQLALLAALLGSGLARPCAARADHRPPWRLRASAAGGFVVSADQQALLALDLPLAEGRVRAGYVFEELLVLELGLGGGAFFSEALGPGALLDLTVGAELGATAGPVRGWVAAAFGAGLTGALVRPVLRLAVGVELSASEEVALGPTLAYGHVFQEDGPGFTDDAQFLSLGLSLSWRPAAAAPEAPEAPAPPAPARRAPPPGPPPLEAPRPSAELLSMVDEAVGVAPRELLVPVLFEFDSTRFVACSVASLHALREHLEAHPEIRRLEIEGHADGSGADAYNEALAARRAEAVRDWLVARGVDPARLTVTSRGERAPVEDEAEAAGRQQNRRVRFRVLLEEAP
jgi:outer membrane protein OmpA-like peptidoglycan-associated protein